MTDPREATVLSNLKKLSLAQIAATIALLRSKAAPSADDEYLIGLLTDYITDDAGKYGLHATYTVAELEAWIVNHNSTIVREA